MGLPIPINDTPRSSLITIYCVQRYWWDGRRPARGILREYRSADLAQRAGRAAARKAFGVAVFSVTGNPAGEYWRPPQIIELHGQVPDEEQGVP